MQSEITRENILFYLKELAKEYKRQNRHSLPVELTSVVDVGNT